MSEAKFIAIMDCLWHPTRAQRSLLKNRGYYVYDMRTWDEGGGNTIEPFVAVNYEGSVITNFKITDWDIKENGLQVINDMHEWIEKNSIEDRSFETSLEDIVKQILEIA